MIIDILVVGGAWLTGGFLLGLMTAVVGTPLLMVPGLIGMFVAASLYEPILVSKRGATVGHRCLGLQVVNGRGELLTFGQALARVLLKGSIGAPSFLWMAMTQRHQALHDLATRSTVRVVDPAAHPERRVLLERAEPVGRGVSTGRRILTTVAYQIAAFIAYMIPSVVLVSDACTFQGLCGVGELLLSTLGTWIWLAVAGAILIFGWRGYLPGARPSR